MFCRISRKKTKMSEKIDCTTNKRRLENITKRIKKERVCYIFNCLLIRKLFLNVETEINSKCYSNFFKKED